MQLRLSKTKYLNNKCNMLFKVNKAPSTSKAWKNILDQKNLLKKGPI